MKEDTPATNFILFCIVSVILFLESIYTLILLLNKGIYRKQILSTNSKLGFDIVIR